MHSKHPHADFGFHRRSPAKSPSVFGRQHRRRCQSQTGCDWKKHQLERQWAEFGQLGRSIEERTKTGRAALVGDADQVAYEFRLGRVSINVQVCYARIRWTLSRIKQAHPEAQRDGLADRLARMKFDDPPRYDARRLQELSSGRYLEFGVGVNNLTDERYIGGMLDEFTQRFVVAAPRTASVTVSLGF